MAIYERATDFMGSTTPPISTGRCLFLLSPSGGGKHAVVDRIKTLELAPVEFCVRDTTRPTQSWDNGSHRNLTHEEFHARMRGSEYLTLMTDGTGNLFGIRRVEVVELLNQGKIPVLRGLVSHVQDLKGQLAEQDPSASLVSVFMTTEPEDAWWKVVEERGFDVEGRVSTSMHDLCNLNDPKRNIDRIVVNSWGHLDETAHAIAGLLR